METFLGQIALFPGEGAPSGWTPCDGRLLRIQDSRVLFAILGDRFGGDGITTFGVPDLRGRSEGSEDGGPGATPDVQPFLAIDGLFPPRDDGGRNFVDPLIGQIVLFSGGWVPPGWSPCDGRLLPVASNMNLFSILSTRFGGDGRVSFALPDLGAGARSTAVGDAESSEAPMHFLNRLEVVQGQIMGQVVLFAGPYEPAGWADCDGRTLPIDAHPELYSRLGTRFGGDGQTTFALPDLQDRVMMPLEGSESGARGDGGGFLIALEGRYPTRW